MIVTIITSAITAAVVSMALPFLLNRWEARYELFKKEWEDIHDDYAKNVGYDHHDPDSRIYWLRDRHASLFRYIQWENDQLSRRLRRLNRRRKRK